MTTGKGTSNKNNKMLNTFVDQQSNLSRSSMSKSPLRNRRSNILAGNPENKLSNKRKKDGE